MNVLIAVAEGKENFMVPWALLPYYLYAKPVSIGCMTSR